jgi:prepilin-type processing-associated H-X9-DG protein
MADTCLPLAAALGTLLASGTRIALLYLFLILGLIASLIFQCTLSSRTSEGRPRPIVLLICFRFVKTSLLIVLVGCMILALWNMLTIDEREAPRRSQCRNHLKQIGLALHNYHDTYNCLPPAYAVDEEGRPLYSWRVLLLPYMDDRERELYPRFRLDQPWDSAHNLKLLNATPEYFGLHCPSDEENPGTETNYVMIVGTGSLSQGPNCVAFDQITDGTSNTIAVVEVTGSGISWTEPRDLVVQEVSFRINDADHLGISSHHPGGAQVLFCDGSTRFLPESTDPQLIQAMTTIAGGEDVSELWKNH